ncbi:MAG: cobalamin biosynthesis protein CobG [Marinibacterium sp.]
MNEPSVKGWCPGAWRPMRSGDGLIVRVRPALARLSAEKACGLADLADRFGSGAIEITNRANLQIRGVHGSGPEDDQIPGDLLAGLMDLSLVDADPLAESRRNIIVAPNWVEGDATHRVAAALTSRLRDMPDLPAKFGFVVDAGLHRVLDGLAGDIRIETARGGGMIVRADGADTGRAVAEGDAPDHAIDHAIELARWFAATRAADGPRRMAGLLETVDMPGTWTGTAPAQGIGAPRLPGQTPLGPSVGLAFGQIGADDLRRLIRTSGAAAIRIAPWRCLILEDGAPPAPDLFAGMISRPDDPLRGTDACPGKPFCPRASVETRDLARRLAPSLRGQLHVSGCAKGCARARPADITLVGRDGLFDLVLNGAPWDEPRWRGFSADDLIRKLA